VKRLVAFYPLGELEGEVLVLVPEPPEVATAADITKQLNRGDPIPSPDLLKAVQRRLRELRDKGLARSTPSGFGGQLGWHRPRSLSDHTG
jgi:hypothetical protein